MVLAIDIGNTNIVMGVFKNEELQFTTRIMTSSDKTSDEMAVTIQAVLHLHGVDFSQIDGSIISSVVPPVTRTVSNAVARLSGKKPLVVGPGIKTGLNILIDNPAQLGADMVVDAVAAIHKYPKPIIIADLGTATTIAAIDKKGQFLGCSIVAGIKVSLEALTEKAAQLQQISIEAPPKIIGKNTIDSLRSGVVYGTASMLDGMVERMEEEMGAKCTVVATGGLSSEIIKHSKLPIIHNPRLLLEGLHLLYLKNRD